MTAQLDRDSFCKGMRQAFDAVDRSGPVPWLQMSPQLRMGHYFAFPLPERISDAIMKTHALFDLALDFDPAELDQPPIIETAWGDLPVSHDPLCVFLEKLAERPNDER